jgi:anti-sigma regulatory factor (Ser/Thr protein kinase)
VSSWSTPATLAAARVARDWAAAASVTGSLKENERDDVMLVISELVTKAVRHVTYAPGEATVSLAVGVATPRLRIEVCDCGTGCPLEGVDPPALDAPSGRGVWTEIKR